MATRQYSTFILDGLWFGVDVTNVQEVIRYQETTPVPLAHPTVTGLINLRGQIVTAIDLRTRLELPPPDGDRRPMNVVLRTSDGAVSLLVDEISDVIDVGDDTWEAPPETLDGVARELILGTHKLEGALLLVLDVARPWNCNRSDSTCTPLDWAASRCDRLDPRGLTRRGACCER